jgi:hypothetical protein
MKSEELSHAAATILRSELAAADESGLQTTKNKDLLNHGDLEEE